MFSHFIDSILNLPPDVLSTWGYAILFIFSIVESLPLIGLAIPGAIIVIACGFFAHIGILHIVPTILIAAVGAFIGDAISYFLGKKYGYTFLTRLGKYIFLKPVHFEKAKNVLHAHPGKSLVIGRFHALSRCIMPFAAGSVEVPLYIFIPFAAFGAIAWAVFNIILGIIFGQSFLVASKYVGVIFFVALGISVLMVYSYRFISNFTAKNKRFIDRYQFYPLLLNIISVYTLAKISEGVLMGNRIHRLDSYINHSLQFLRSSILTEFLVSITQVCTPTNLTIIAVLLALYFAYRHRWYYLTLLPVSLTAGLISVSLLKRSIHVLRPLHPLVQTSDFSFPSGHATLALIFFGLLAYFFKDSFKKKIWRNTYISVCVAFIILVSFSRVYLNAHWLSDVLAGLALGTFWLTFFVILFHFFTSLSTRRVQAEFNQELN